MSRQYQDENILPHLKELITRIIEKKNPKLYVMLFQKYHEADIAEALEDSSLDQKISFFKNLNPEMGADVLAEMDVSDQSKLILSLKSEYAAKYIEELDPDIAVDLLEELLETNEEKATEIFQALPKEDASDFQELLNYKEGSAGSIMTSEVISIPEKLSVKEAIDHIKRQNPPDSEISFYIYIVDTSKKLVGYTTLRNIMMASPDTRIYDIRNDNPIKANVNEDQESVAKKIEKYDLVSIPVVNDFQQLVGLITVDDIVDVVIEEATEDLYKLSGTSDYDEQKLLEGHIGYAIKSRLPWLIITIFGGLIGSHIITKYASVFSSHHFTLALSLSFAPLLVGLGGNIGNQSATIIVRGLSTGYVRIDKPLRYILRETAIGFTIGLILSIFLYIVTLYFVGNPLLTKIVSISLLINLTTASLIGSSLPIILKKLSIDPAVASAPFLSTSIDIIGQLIYFALTLYVIAKLAL